MWETRSRASTDILDNINKISDKALKKSSNPDVYVPTDNWWSNPKAVKKANATKDHYSKAYYQLSKEPLIAAVLVETEDGERRVYYFSRRIQAPDMPKEGYFTHMMAPVGQLATYDPGDIYTYNDSYDLKILSKVTISPQKIDGKWDSAPSIFYEDEDKPVRVASLLKFLDTSSEDQLKSAETHQKPSQIPSIDNYDLGSGDFDEPDFDEDKNYEANNRDILRGTGLRDQAILDKVQDNIFRLPISSQLMISGPPGSGKTTTLVRRLAQKTNLDYLSPQELERVKTAHNPDVPHELSWIIFTPSELLESYLAETFNREGIAAPKERIWTWEKYSLTVAREHTFLLKKAGNARGFVLNTKSSNLNSATLTSPFSWIRTVESWLSELYFKDIGTELDLISNTEGGRLVELIQRLKIATNRKNKDSIFRSMIQINSESRELQNAINEIDTNLNKFLNGRLQRLLRNRKYDNQRYELLRENAERADASEDDLNTLKKFIADVRYSEKEKSNLFQRLRNLLSDQNLPEENNIKPNKSLEVFESELIKSMRKIVIEHVGTLGNVIAYNDGSKQSLFSKIFSRTDKPENRETKYSKLADFFGQELFNIKELNDIRNKSVATKALLKIKNSAENYFSNIAQHYRRFRKENQNTFYLRKEIEELSLDRDEMDALLLILMSSANNLFMSINENDPGWKFLSKYKSALRNQVLVDEASDFSTIQLAAMFEFSHPAIKSFCASGDYDQSLTLNGVRDFAEFKTALPSISEHRLSVGYRQSETLSQFIYKFGRENLNLSSSFEVPKAGQSKGVLPAMFEAKDDLSAQFDWVANRIKEIEALSSELPSIAILVPEKSMVKKLESELASRVENIPISGHEEAGNLGRDQEIRIFPVQYVKGLEFEAAIFVGVDVLKSLEPELFSRYLYVGATRAATFLGITADTNLPKEIKKYGYVNSWDTK